MGRFTSHGEVVFETNSNGKLVHPFWGRFEDYWPGKPEPSMAKQGGCGGCGAGGPPAPPVFPTIEAWFDSVRTAPSDFHEHMVALKDLTTKCNGTVVELSHWLKPALLSIAAAKPKSIISICPGPKPEWPQLKQLLEGKTELVTHQVDSLIPEPVACDLLFIDTLHQAERLYSEMMRWAPFCAHYIVIHCTNTFGEKGDNGGPGVLPAIRRYVRENPKWSVIKHYTNNNGLTVISCDPADKKVLPSTLKQAWNYTKALAGHIATGRKTLPVVEIEARLDVCSLCEMRTANRCAVCGCYLDEGPNGEEGKAMWEEQECPLGLWK